MAIQHAASRAWADVDEERVVFLSVEQTVGSPGEGRGNDAGLVEKLAADAYLQFGGTALQTVHLLMIVVGIPSALRAQLPDGLADAPQLWIVGVGLESPLVGEGEHLVVDAGGVADTQHIDAAVYKLFGNPVNGHVALCAHQHLTLAA